MKEPQSTGKKSRIIPKTEKVVSKKEKRIKNKKKDEKERIQLKKDEEKKLKQSKTIEYLNSISTNFLSAFSSLFVITAMTVGIFKLVKGNSFESVLAGIVCAVFIIVGTWFNERI